MITGKIILEDSTLSFIITNSSLAILTISDNLTSNQGTLEVTPEQLDAIIGTSICGTNEAVMNAALPIAESAFPADWPIELRPMP